MSRRAWISILAAALLVTAILNFLLPAPGARAVENRPAPRAAILCDAPWSATLVSPDADFGVWIETQATAPQYVPFPGASMPLPPAGTLFFAFEEDGPQIGAVVSWDCRYAYGDAPAQPPIEQLVLPNTAMR